MAFRAKMVDLDMMNKMMPDGDLTFIDVGAFTGSCAKAMAKTFPNATVHAIEACPVNFKVLKSKTKRCSNIKPHHVAISDCNCSRLKFYITRDQTSREKHGDVTSQSNSVYRKFLSSRGKKTEEVEVKALSMIDFCKSNEIGKINFIKINCEGCEYKIFDGDNSFLDFTDMIVIEFHVKVGIFKTKEFIRKRQKIVKLFTDKGFKFVEGNRNLKSGKHILQVWSK